jgi:hypothetical protein
MPLALSGQRVMPDIFWDTELRSATSLRLVGAWNYAAHPTTTMLCLCYAVGDGEVQTWINRSLLETQSRDRSLRRRAIRRAGA